MLVGGGRRGFLVVLLGVGEDDVRFSDVVVVVVLFLSLSPFLLPVLRPRVTLPRLPVRAFFLLAVELAGGALMLALSRRDDDGGGGVDTEDVIGVPIERPLRVKIGCGCASAAIGRGWEVERCIDGV